MKNFHQLVALPLIALACIITTSCQKDEEPEPVASTESTETPGWDIETLNLDQIAEIGMEVGQLIEALPTEPESRSAQALYDYTMQVSATEKDIAKSMQPLVKVGKDARQASLEMVKAQPLQCEVTQEEIQMLETLTDEELAGVGLMLSVLCADNNDVNILTEDALMQSVYIQCLFSAIGITDVIDILKDGGSIGAIIGGTRGLINAKTMGKVLKALGIRYLGWIGVGIMIYDYVSCVKNSH